MRDIALTIIIFGALPFVLRYPWVGILLWNWISLMSPHRLTYGFAHDWPWAQIVGLATLVGFLLSGEQRKIPWMSVTVVLAMFAAWCSITTPFALNPDQEVMEAAKKFWKIVLMIFVGLVVMQQRKRLHYLVLVMAFSIGFYGIKGGLFTFAGGGSQQVLGPSGSFLEGNNEIGLALVMVLPLFRYLQLQQKRELFKWGYGVAMALIGLAALGTQSRGALVGAAAMLLFLWFKSPKKLMLGMGMIIAVAGTLTFMPDSWWNKMETITEYKEDGSAQGRINAWGFAINLAAKRPLVGGGFETFTPELFQEYAPNPKDFHDAHSIYFEVLAEHGFIGLAIFLVLAVATWRSAAITMRLAKLSPDLEWARHLAAMAQVSLIGFWTSGAFLGLAYFDGYYCVISIVVLARLIVERELKAKEEARAKAAGMEPAAPMPNPQLGSQFPG